MSPGFQGPSRIPGVSASGAGFSLRHHPSASSNSNACLPPLSPEPPPLLQLPVREEPHAADLSTEPRARTKATPPPLNEALPRLSRTACCRLQHPPQAWARPLWLPEPGAPARPAPGPSAYRSEQRLALGGASQRPARARGPGRRGATSPTSSLAGERAANGPGPGPGKGGEGGRGRARARGSERGRQQRPSSVLPRPPPTAAASKPRETSAGGRGRSRSAGGKAREKRPSPEVSAPAETDWPSEREVTCKGRFWPRDGARRGLHPLPLPRGRRAGRVQSSILWSPSAHKLEEALRKQCLSPTHPAFGAITTLSFRNGYTRPRL